MAAYWQAIADELGVTWDEARVAELWVADFRSWLSVNPAVIEVLAECRHGFALVTKSSGVERDLDLVGEMGRAGMAAVYMSLTTLDGGLARIMEPRATAPLTPDHFDPRRL